MSLRGTTGSSKRIEKQYHDIQRLYVTNIRRRYGMKQAVVTTRSCFLCALLIGAMMGAPAKAEFVAIVTDSVEQDSSDRWRYTYNVANESDSDAHIFALDLAVGFDVEVMDIRSPNGWQVFYQVGDAGLSWLSGDPRWDIAPGNAVAFSILANAPPGDYVATVEGEADDGSIVRLSVPVRAPSLVPEPSTMMLSAAGGLSGIAWCCCTHRRRAKQQ